MAPHASQPSRELSSAALGLMSVPSDGDTRSTQDSLRTALKRLRRFFDQHPDGIWCFELDPPLSVHLATDEALALCIARGRLVHCNDALARMYGYVHASELLGTPLSEFIDFSREDNCRYLRSFWEGGLRLREGESHEHDRHGNDRIFSNTLIGVKRGDQLVRVWGTQRDITPQRAIEARRAQLQRLQAVEALAAGIAHHFNNMLTVISGNLSLILDSAPLSASSRDALESASGAADHAAELTRQLLHFSQRNQPNFEPIDWPGCVRSACRRLASQLGDRVRIESRLEDMPRVLGDKTLVSQLVAHLVQHAHSSLRDGGVLTIALRSESIAKTQQLMVLELRYVDGGSAPVERPLSLVDPFFSKPGSKVDRSLLQAYAIVRNLAGTLRSSTADGVTTIRAELPAERAVSRGAVAPAHARRSGSVLLVNRDPQTQAALSRFLSASGQRVVTARSAGEALRLVETHDEPIELLICDVRMPDKSGIALARELCARRPGLHVLLTADGDGDIDLAPDLAHAAVMRKPFTGAALDRMLRALRSNPH